MKEIKTRTIIALAIPAGIAKAFLTAKMFYILGVIVAWLLTGAMAHAGEYTEGRAGMNRGRTDNLAADVQSFNNGMSQLSNNQQFLDGLKAYSEGSNYSLLNGIRDATGKIVDYQQGYKDGAAEAPAAGTMMGNPGDLGFTSGTYGSVAAGPLSGYHYTTVCSY